MSAHAEFPALNLALLVEDDGALTVAPIKRDERTGSHSIRLTPRAAELVAEKIELIVSRDAVSAADVLAWFGYARAERETAARVLENLTEIPQAIECFRLFALLLRGWASATREVLRHG